MKTRNPEPMTTTKRKRHLVTTGHVVATPGVLAIVGAFPIEYMLARHVRGDWGDVSAADWAANDAAWDNDDERILSVYSLPNGVEVWIITEADRSSTCVLLPEEY